MMRIPLMLVFVAILTASGSVAGQSQRSGVRTAEGAPPAQAASEPVPRLEATPSSAALARLDADARACLDFVTNRGVMKCAEQYRSHKRVAR